jgi:hypothetical protein
MSLEKPYLRLTTHPRKEDVRPLRVLIKSLAHIKGRYVQDEDFEWANEQLKSVRQDLTVQRIRNPFVLDVYETHARILLEHGDLDEFNRCQTMIKGLTTERRNCRRESETRNKQLAFGSGFEGVGGSLTREEDSVNDNGDGEDDDRPPLQQSPESSDEFCAYSILYAYVRNSWMDLKSELARSRLTSPSASSVVAAAPTIHRGIPPTGATLHALTVVRAMDDHDYHTFFRLYATAPHMSAYLMDFLVKRKLRLKSKLPFLSLLSFRLPSRAPVPPVWRRKHQQE